MKKRVFSLDLLRVIACYFVIQVHAGEFFYIGEGGTILQGPAPYWVNLLNTIGRAAVPLFIMITGFFVLPVKNNMRDFFKKRFTRVAIPFVIWCVLYAFYKMFTGETGLAGTFINILKIPVNFGTEVGHLWYIYMLIGLYLFFPVISPWIKTASKKALQFFLGLWLFTLFLPYIHLMFPEVLGECYWNDTPMLYYFSGMLGYAILGVYLKKYHIEKTKYDLPVGLLLLIVGYAVTAGIFCSRLQTQTLVSELELSWGYNTINVAVMALGIFLALKNVHIDGVINRAVTSISNISYGMYLIHIMFLNLFYELFHNVEMAVYLKIPLLTICTFVVSYIVIKLISFLPKSKYIIG